MIYACCDPRRRELVIAHPTLNGIDSLEVLDADAPAPSPRQRTLLLRFVRPAPALTVDNVEIVGGERVTGIGIEWITRADAPDPALIDPIEADLPGLLTSLPDADHVLALRTDSSGDWSNYTLRLVSAPGALGPPAGVDRVLAEIGFSFKVECPADFDCAHVPPCPTAAVDGPALSYLARDYQSFRRLMLDRMAQLAPGWTERNAADLGITLVELLAYTGDRLSYAADAASEGYLATARRRSSVRRHARLVDYQMHDGANARLWMHVEAQEGVSEVEGITSASITTGDVRFFTHLLGLDAVVAVSELAPVVDRTPEFFEPLHELRLFEAHNAIDFYTWGDEECCLPAGATRATLVGDLPHLAVGDVLIFQERLGPRTGAAADADPAHRHPVALCAVEAGVTDELTGQAVTEIRWSDDDALPFAICVSARRDEALGGDLVERVSHALGNNVLVDHGRTILAAAVGVVPTPHLEFAPQPRSDHCEPLRPVPVPPRFRPRLAEGPVTQAADFTTDVPLPSARSAIEIDLAGRRPALELRGTTLVTTSTWEARRDLLSSSASDPHVVVEVERDGLAQLRFGNDANGMRPDVGTIFEADYRVGNGTAGNVGRDAVRHVMSASSDLSAVRSVTNPLAGRGGVEPETIDEVRQAAPVAWRRQERAVTVEDYAEVARRHPDVQRAAATFRWNGHGHTVFITVDRFGGRPVTADFERELRDYVERFRMAGYDLEVDAPRFVSIELGLFLCAAPDHFRSQVKAEVVATLSSHDNADGTRGFFHPDNFTFGDPVWLSAIVARVMGVPGVDSVTPRVFRRRATSDPTPLLDGVVETGRLEIARLANDPNHPERGSIEIEMAGGK